MCCREARHLKLVMSTNCNTEEISNINRRFIDKTKESRLIKVFEYYVIIMVRINLQSISHELRKEVHTKDVLQ